jgi:hypothetical protein
VLFRSSAVKTDVTIMITINNQTGPLTYLIEYRNIIVRRFYK